MKLKDNLLAISDEDFKVIHEIITQSAEKREEFFLKPEKVLSEHGIKINRKTLEILKKIVNLHINKEKTEFNEKLVLSSSSGY
jgi:hypothetical protein